jgi:hypothetical protein
VLGAIKTKEYLGAKNSLMTKVVKVKGLEKCFQKKRPFGHFI